MTVKESILEQLLIICSIYPQISDVKWDHKATKKISDKKKVQLVDFSGRSLKFDLKNPVIAQLNKLIFEYLNTFNADWETTCHTQIASNGNQINVSLDGTIVGSIDITKFQTVKAANRLKDPVCPVCNGPMQLKNVHTGIFWSCKSYPKCKSSVTGHPDHPQVFKWLQSDPGSVIHLMQYLPPDEFKLVTDRLGYNPTMASTAPSMPASVASIPTPSKSIIDKLLEVYPNYCSSHPKTEEFNRRLLAAALVEPTIKGYYFFHEGEETHFCFLDKNGEELLGLNESIKELIAVKELFLEILTDIRPTWENDKIEGQQFNNPAGSFFPNDTTKPEEYIVIWGDSFYQYVNEAQRKPLHIHTINFNDTEYLSTSDIIYVWLESSADSFATFEIARAINFRIPVYLAYKKQNGNLQWLYEKVFHHFSASDMEEGIRRLRQGSQSPNCPLCSSPTTYRYSKKGGKFWGCSCYPSCTGLIPYSCPKPTAPKVEWCTDEELQEIRDEEGDIDFWDYYTPSTLTVPFMEWLIKTFQNENITLVDHEILDGEITSAEEFKAAYPEYYDRCLADWKKLIRNTQKVLDHLKTNGPTPKEELNTIGDNYWDTCKVVETSQNGKPYFRLPEAGERIPYNLVISRESFDVSTHAKIVTDGDISKYSETKIDVQIDGCREFKVTIEGAGESFTIDHPERLIFEMTGSREREVLAEVFNLANSKNGVRNDYLTSPLPKIDFP